VIVDESHIVSLRIRPSKYDAPSFVDANAVKPSPVSAQGFEPIPWRRTKVSENSRSVDHIELPKGHWHNIGWQRSYAPSSGTVK
jgi:hypothetical protein